MTSPNDSVNHPKHYNDHKSGIECITIVRHMNFNLGNAVKYIWRAGLKSKDPIEDLKKAIFYLNDEISRIESENPERLNLVFANTKPVEQQSDLPFSAFPPISPEYQIPPKNK